MGPLTLGLAKLMQVCPWLLAAPEHTLHQPLPLTESLLRRCLQPQEVWRPLANSCPVGENSMSFRYTPILTVLVLWICSVSLLGISNFNKPWTSSNIFSRGTMYANSLTCKDVTKRESQGLVWGSILFTLYINDLEERRCSKWITLADDIKWRGRQNKEGGATKFRMYSLGFGDSYVSSKFWSM